MKAVIKAITTETQCPPITDWTPGDNLTVSVESFDDLVIEKVGPQRVSVAHYYTQNGDLMSDPEIVFITPAADEDDGWTPVRYTQHPHIHVHNSNGLTDLNSFIKRWCGNLREQGFVTAASESNLSV